MMMELKERVARAINEVVSGALFDVPFDLLRGVVAVYEVGDRIYRDAVVRCVERGGVALRFWWDSPIGVEIARLKKPIRVNARDASELDLIDAVVVKRGGDGGIICVSVSTFSDTIARTLRRWMPYVLLSKLLS